MKNNILFISTLCSSKVYKQIFSNSFKGAGNAIQKFHTLIVEGLASHKENKVEVLSAIPVSPYTHRKRLWRIPKENEDNIIYEYVLIINVLLIKNIIVFFNSFIKILLGKFNSNSGRKVIICDVLSPSISLGSLIASKFRGIKSIAIVTDMPGLGVASDSVIKSFKAKLIKFFFTKYDGFIFITKEMNSVINSCNKPFIIMEGLVDSTMKQIENSLTKKSTERIILYAGGIHERYGIKNLLDGFKMLKDKDLRLYIYGEGPMENKMQNYMAADSRICYKGVVENKIVVKEQLTATLLVNPRPSNEEFTKYSFPSKNMEYMVSGTPIATTLLPGMPKEYLPYVFLLEDESTIGVYKKLKSILSKSRSELHEFGYLSKAFVLEKKNNIIQTKKITSLIDLVLEEN